MDQDETGHELAGLGHGHGHNVLDGDPRSSPKGHSRPYFRLISVVAKLLDDGSRCLFVGVGLGPGDIVLHGDPSPKRLNYLAAHRHIVNVLTSNITFLIFAVLVV